MHLITLAKAAEYLAESKRQVKRRVDAGELKGYRLTKQPNARLRIDRDELDTFIASRAVRSVPNEVKHDA